MPIYENKCGFTYVTKGELKTVYSVQFPDAKLFIDHCAGNFTEEEIADALWYGLSIGLVNSKLKRLPGEIEKNKQFIEGWMKRKFGEYGFVEHDVQKATQSAEDKELLGLIKSLKSKGVSLADLRARLSESEE